MKFRIGQRVRVIANHIPPHLDPPEVGNAIIGCEGVIVRQDSHPNFPLVWIVHIHGSGGPTCDGSYPPDEWGCLESELAPLLDPRAEQLIADLNRFAAIAEKRPLGEKLADRLRFA